ncbi:MAG: hypothetical protein MUE33_04150 [Cytophagaceae bacterium]|jgi:hypothetical protein|nr:hypothetical protein [Cytophagaceae bacterium]
MVRLQRFRNILALSLLLGLMVFWSQAWGHHHAPEAKGEHWHITETCFVCAILEFLTTSAWEYSSPSSFIYLTVLFSILTYPILTDIFIHRPLLSWRDRGPPSYPFI